MNLLCSLRFKLPSGSSPTDVFFELESELSAEGDFYFWVDIKVPDGSTLQAQSCEFTELVEDSTTLEATTPVGEDDFAE